MNQKINYIHTDEYLKRQAKKIKKELNIPYVQALDKAATQAGFSNWKHYLNSKSITLTIKKTIAKSTLILGEQPSKKSFNPYRNLLVAGTNELLNKNLISLDSSKNHQEDGYLFTNIFDFPSVVIWREISFEEILISVWWKYDHRLHPQAELSGSSRENFTNSIPLAERKDYKKFIGVTASAWLERKNGKFLQGKENRGIVDIYTRRGEKTALEKMSYQKPNGYETEGKFYDT
jgi:hypothetical protein